MMLFRRLAAGRSRLRCLGRQQQAWGGAACLHSTRPVLSSKAPQRPSPAAAAAPEAGSTSTSSSKIFKFKLDKEPQTIYEHPELYDAAFSFRDFKQEVAFLKDAYAKHTEGAPLQSVLELGCGPASHSIGLSSQGVPKALGLDLSNDMLKYARWKAKAKPAAPNLELAQGDMSKFDLQGQQFDMILCLLGTFSHMLDNAQATSCFQCVSKHLRPGGLLLLELAHPGDLFDGTYIIGDSAKEVWEVPMGQTHKILVEWGAEFDNFDPVTQVLHRTVAMNIMRGDEAESSLEEVVQQRQFTVQEINFLASASGLQVEELYGEMDLDVGLGHEEAYRMIAVLKKTV